MCQRLRASTLPLSPQSSGATSPTTSTAPPPSPPVSTYPRASLPRPPPPRTPMHPSPPPWPDCLLNPAPVHPRRTVLHLPPPPPRFAPRVAITTDTSPASHPAPLPPHHLSCIIRVRACLPSWYTLALCASYCRALARSRPTAVSDRRRQPPISEPPTPVRHSAAPPWTSNVIASVESPGFPPVCRAPCRQPPPDHRRNGRF